MTDDRKIVYNKGEPVKCDCGQIIAYRKEGILMLYCKKCKRQIPYTYHEFTQKRDGWE